MIKRIAVFVSGSGSNLQSLIDATLSGEIENGSIDLVVGSKPDLYAFERAKNHHIHHVVKRVKDFSTTEEYNADVLGLLKDRKIDLIVLAGYLAILTPEITKAYAGRILNIHPALIPSFCGKGYYGMHVHEAVYTSGVKLTGATVHFVDGGIDTGAILIQESCPVSVNDTPETIQKKVLEIEHRILPRAVDAVIKGEVIFDGERAFIKK